MRLFDKQEAIKLLRGKCVGKYPSTFMMGLFAAADEIEKLPETDAIPVSWLKEKLTGHPEMRYATSDGICEVLRLWEERKHND